MEFRSRIISIAELKVTYTKRCYDCRIRPSRRGEKASRKPDCVDCAGTGESSHEDWISFWDAFNAIEELQSCCMINPMIFHSEALEAFILQNELGNKMSRGGVYPPSLEKLESFLVVLDAKRVSWETQNAERKRTTSDSGPEEGSPAIP